MEIIKSYRNKKNSFNFKILFFIAISIFAFLYFIDSVLINLNKKNYLIRELSELREKKPNEICMEFDGNIKYDLFGLEDEEILLFGNKLQLKFCHNINKTDSSCIYNKDKIIRLAGSIKGEKKNKNKIEIDKKNDIVKIYLAKGDKFNGTDDKYQINIELRCNKTVTFDITNDEKFNPDEEYNLFLYADSKYACGKKDYIELKKAERIIAGSVAIIIGFIIGIFGYNQRKVGMFIVCCFGSVVLAALIASLFDIDKIIFIVIGVVFLLIGIGLFFLFKRKKDYLKYYMLLIGGLCGYPIGLLIYNLFFSIIDTEQQKLLNIIIIVFCIILGVILGRFFPKHTCIAGTSIMGAYLIMRGIGFFLYEKIEFIDEHKLYDLAHSGNYEKIADIVWPKFLIYPAILIFFIIVLIIIQIKINPKWKDYDSYKDYSDSEQVDDSPGEADFKLMDREHSVKPDEKSKEDVENQDNQKNNEE
jgi:LPXTG-motif cell wall-anchored protein